jgi:molecular chaperone DnaK (HSP70)
MCCKYLDVFCCHAEPVAASLAYGLSRAEEDALILVFDLGGGTFDVSLVECFEGCLEVIATEGDARLGGDDWDRCLMHWVLQQADFPNTRCL